MFIDDTFTDGRRGARAATFRTDQRDVTRRPPARGRTPNAHSAGVSSMPRSADYQRQHSAASSMTPRHSVIDVRRRGGDGRAAQPPSLARSARAPPPPIRRRHAMPRDATGDDQATRRQEPRE